MPVALKLRTDRVGRRDRAAFEKALSALSAKLQTVSMCDDGDNVLDNAPALINIVTFDTVCHASPLISFQRVVLVYKNGQEKLNNLYYQVKEQRR